VQEIDRGVRLGNPVWAVHHPPGVGQAADHQCVPAGELLVVTPRAHPGFARGEELLRARWQQRRGHFIRPVPVRPRPPSKGARGWGSSSRSRNSAASVETVDRRRHCKFLGSLEQRAHLIRRPHIELAFVAFAVGIERGIESARPGARISRSSQSTMPSAVS
jgi:hypothetical protein